MRWQFVTIVIGLFLLIAYLVNLKFQIKKLEMERANFKNNTECASQVDVSQKG